MLSENTFMSTENVLYDYCVLIMRAVDEIWE